MNGEERRHECGRPRRARQPPQGQKQKDGAERVKEDAGQQMHPRVHPPQTDVEHVREPRQRIPADLGRGQSPGDVAVQDVRVLVDELPVVEVEKCVRCDLPEDDEGDGDEERDDRPIARAPIANSGLSLRSRDRPRLLQPCFPPHRAG